MTYILALHQPGIVALLSDTRISWNIPGRTGANVGLKLGRFFEGCIFGVTGNTFRARNFVLDFKELVEFDKGTPFSYWKKFEQYTQNYDYPTEPEEQFQLILSTRAFERPRLYTVDSFYQTLYQQPIPPEFRDDHAFVFAFGSGRASLDSIVAANFARRLKDMQPQILKQEGPRMAQMIAPYLLCLWLSELTLGYQGPILEDEDGVGGPFHFVYQTPTEEVPQGPALYLFATGVRKTRHFYPWGYRVVHIPSGALYVERVYPARFPMFAAPDSGSAVLMDSTTTAPELARLFAEDEAKAKAIVKEQVEALPFYVFCGFGNPDANPLRSRAFNAILSDEGRKGDIFASDGTLREDVHQLMLNQYLENFPDS